MRPAMAASTGAAVSTISAGLSPFPITWSTGRAGPGEVLDAGGAGLGDTQPVETEQARQRVGVVQAPPVNSY